MIVESDMSDGWWWCWFWFWGFVVCYLLFVPCLDLYVGFNSVGCFCLCLCLYLYVTSYMFYMSSMDWWSLCLLDGVYSEFGSKEKEKIIILIWNLWLDTRRKGVELMISFHGVFDLTERKMKRVTKWKLKKRAWNF